MRDDANLKIEGLELGRGTREKKTMRVAELPDGSWVEIAFEVIRGAQRGPILYIGAAFHGDEVAGTEVAGQLATQLQPDELSGTVIVVPVQNPQAFQIQHRFNVGHMLKSPMDQNPADPWVAFPGDPHGNLAGLIAHALFDTLMRHTHYMVDIHTPTTGGRYAPYAFLPPTRCGEAVQEAEALARAFGADYILANDKGMYVGDKNPHTVLAEQGIPAFGIEIGEGGRNDKKEVDRAIRGLRNLLKFLTMLPGNPEKLGKQFVMRTMEIVRSKRAGLLHLTVDLNDEVKPGQTVARILNPFGELLEEVKAPIAGPVVRIATFGVVATGERVVNLGVTR